MNDWQMLTLVGEDRPGIVARVTDALYRAGCNLGEASMMRLGGNFTIMMMVQGGADAAAAVAATAQEMGLRVHVDAIAGGLHHHQAPNIQVRVAGADRAGIVAQVTAALAGQGFNILELESDVAGSQNKPVYIMHIQGYSDAALEDLQAAVAAAAGRDVEVSVDAIDMMIG